MQQKGALSAIFNMAIDAEMGRLQVIWNRRLKAGEIGVVTNIKRILSHSLMAIPEVEDGGE